MGTGHIASAVADAGPLIHLHEIGALTLLTIVRQLHVPDAVWHETMSQNRVDEPSIHKLGNVVRHQLDTHLIDQFIRAHQFLNLHPGEREALYVCHHLRVPLLFTDDLAVRGAAKSIGVRPVGSLGIVVRAYRVGMLSQTAADQTLRDLQNTSSLFVTNAIVEQALMLLERHASTH